MARPGPKSGRTSGGGQSGTECRPAGSAPAVPAGANRKQNRARPRMGRPEPQSLRGGPCAAVRRLSRDRDRDRVDRLGKTPGATQVTGTDASIENGVEYGCVERGFRGLQLRQRAKGARATSLSRPAARIRDMKFWMSKCGAAPASSFNNSVRPHSPAKRIKHLYMTGSGAKPSLKSWGYKSKARSWRPQYAYTFMRALYDARVIRCCERHHSATSSAKRRYLPQRCERGC